VLDAVLGRLPGPRCSIIWLSTWDIDKVEKYGPKFLSGLWTTLSWSACRSIARRDLVAADRAWPHVVAQSGAVSRLAYAYVYFFRGTPLIAQLS
jgi:polar amino acid transport system permease protein